MQLKLLGIRKTFSNIGEKKKVRDSFIVVRDLAIKWVLSSQSSLCFQLSFKQFCLQFLPCTFTRFLQELCCVSVCIIVQYV